MALPTIEIDWRINHKQIGNTGLGSSDYQDFWLQLKRALTNGTGWTGNWKDCSGAVSTDPTACVVTQSSNAVTADATDRWNLLTDISNAGGVAAHSWLVLTFPGIGAGCQVCFDVFHTGGASYTLLNSCTDGQDPAVAGGGVIVSQAAGFAASVLTTRRPRGNSAQQDETQIYMRRDFLNANSNVLGNLSGATTWQAQMQVMRSSDGAQNRVAVYYNGIPLMFFILDKPKSPFVTSTPHTWNVDDVPWIGAWYSSQTSIINALNMITTGGQWVSASPLYSRLCSAINPTARAVNQCRIGCEAYDGATTITNGLNSASDIDGSYPMMPLSLIGIVSGYRGRLGLVYDMWNVPPLMLEGDSFPNDNSKQYVVMGDFSFPWDRTVLAIL